MKRVPYASGAIARGYVLYGEAEQFYELSAAQKRVRVFAHIERFRV